MYISSADLMTRNLNRRVEIACPINDPRLRCQITWMLEAQMSDTAKASIILSDGTYCRKSSANAFDSQAFFMEHPLQEATGCEENDGEVPCGLAARLKALKALSDKLIARLRG